MTIEIEDFNLDNISIKQKSNKNILNLCVLGFIKQMNLLEFMMELKVNVWKWKTWFHLQQDLLSHKYAKSAIAYITSHNYTQVRLD